MSRASNPYRRAGSWITGTGWTVEAEPCAPTEDPLPTSSCSAIDELRHGYTISDIGMLARLAVDRCRTTTARSETERYDLAWSAIAERLYAADDEPPQRADLVIAGQRAIWDEVNAGLRHDGYHLHLAENGPGSSSSFNKYWSAHASTVPSHETRIVERIALYQILPMLTKQQRDLIAALAALGDYRAVAAALGTTKAHATTALSEGRARFRRWWHQGERPSHHWRHDVRASAGGNPAKCDIREQMKQRRCKERAKRIAAGLEQPRQKPESLTAETVKEIAAAYTAGATIRRCAERFGETEWRIRCALDEAQVRLRQRGRPGRREVAP